MRLKDFMSQPSETVELLSCALVGTEIKIKRDGDPYLSLYLKDFSGSLEVPVWDELDYKNYLNFSFPLSVEVSVRSSSAKGSTDRKNYRLTQPLRVTDVSFENYIKTVDYKFYWSKIKETIDTLSSDYRELVLAILRVEEVRKDFLTHPAALKHHQNYESGLVFHTSNVVGWVEKFYDFYTEQQINLNRDLLLSAAILHDVSKTVEYERDGLGWTSNVFSIEHPLSTIAWIRNLNTTLNDVQLKALQDLILQHHGTYGNYEINSIESNILHFADNLDAKAHCPKTPSFGLDYGLEKKRIRKEEN